MALLAFWLLSIGGLVAGAGGALSPIAAGFAVPLALTLTLGRRWAAEVGAASVLAYAAAAALALRSGEPVALLGAFPELMAVMSLVFTAGLMAIAPGPASGAKRWRSAWPKCRTNCERR